ncbi:uncharacterized protein RHIMIDRAFT_238457 [Rhizopus microsporus ATCC 52813]|uniref:Uncharacterized protein n=1 Tax=Rhizopus microsporus ATCC 52813 TaxID=1340429 RepID=A0A2G4SSQ2_RHIZD|nr:uncharacterized protein RHIMIDRAFT_238457 [Rhizopus microsporus ATCC 52813]PHZ11794.1 hypothetical protein RHIMIDRAFT_238457 [Rhizopus microsporus ATCC 52813]
MTVNIGRMSSETREARKRMIAAEEINELSLEDMVQKVYIDEEACYIVKSFTTEVAFNEIHMPVSICIWFIASIKAVWFTAKVNCHDSNKRNATVFLRHYLEIDSSLRVHTMDETILIQNTVESNVIEAVTGSSDMLQSEVPSEAGSRTDELLTSITSVCRQALESRVHLTFENNNRLLQIYNELRQLFSVNEEMQLPPNINMQTQRK